jgi:hypothetical protein
VNTIGARDLSSCSNVGHTSRVLQISAFTQLTSVRLGDYLQWLACCLKRFCHCSPKYISRENLNPHVARKDWGFQSRYHWKTVYDFLTVVCYHLLKIASTPQSLTFFRKGVLSKLMLSGQESAFDSSSQKWSWYSRACVTLLWPAHTHVYSHMLILE